MSLATLCKLTPAARDSVRAALTFNEPLQAKALADACLLGNTQLTSTQAEANENRFHSQNCTLGNWSVSSEGLRCH